MKLLSAFLLALSFLSSSAFAASPAEWRVKPEQSSVSFAAKNAGAPVLGKFSKIEGTIRFDPTLLAQSTADIRIGLAEIVSDNADAKASLPGADWLDVKRYPVAQFQSGEFRKISATQFAMNGPLTLRGVTKPVTVTFTLEKYQPHAGGLAVAKGEAVLKRSEFGVGQGEWASTDAVADEVKITLTVTAEFMP